MGHRITLYDTLGVASDASEEDIRDAFRRLTRTSHPDRFSGVERAQAEERFQGITEAFNVLSRPESREKYDRELNVGGGGKPGAGLDSKEIARRLAAKGAEAFRAGNLHQAVEHLQMAIDHDEQADRAHYFMGAALIRVPGRERDGLRHLEKAVSLDRHNAAYKAQAAEAALKVGMSSRAERLAMDALALDPTSKKASAVIAKLSGDADSSKGGLLGRFRRKG